MFQNAVVVVGDRFDAGMFEGEDLFGLRSDPQGRVVLGPIAQYTYGGGRYRLGVAPNRVDVAFAAPDVMPQALLEAAQRVAEVIGSAGKAVGVTGVGLNCDSSLPVVSGGAQFCQNLLDWQSANELLNDPVPLSIQMREIDGPVMITVRFEPEVASSGQNLYVAVNAHREVVQDHVVDALAYATEFRSRVEKVHARIRDFA